MRPFALAVLAALACACAETTPYVKSWPPPAPAAAPGPVAPRSGVLFKLHVESEMAGFSVWKVVLYFPRAGEENAPDAKGYQQFEVPPDGLNRFPYDLALVQLATGTYHGMWARVLFQGNHTFTADTTPDNDFSSFRVEPGKITVLGSLDVKIRNEITGRDSGGTHFTTTISRHADSNYVRKIDLIDAALSRPEAASAGWADALRAARKETALHQDLFGAAVRGDLKSLGALLDSGADVNAREVQGYSPLAMAANSGKLASVRFLLERGAKVDQGTNDGMTPLMKASGGCSLDVVQALVERGAAVNRRDDDGYTALMVAAYNGCLDVSKFLVAKGADVAARTKGGKSAADFARSKSHPDVAMYLSGVGGDR